MKTKVFGLREGRVLHIGTVKGVFRFPETVWHLSNHSCWNRAKRIRCGNCQYFPTENDKGYTNSDMFFTYKGYTYFALPIGFAKVPKEQFSKAMLLYNRAQNTCDFQALEDLSINK